MKSILHNISGLLAIIGAINWGLVGLFDMNLVTSLFGTMPMLVKGIYIAIGIAGLVFAALEASEQKYV